jgi:predicted membrane-bound spermidine synthase
MPDVLGDEEREAAAVEALGRWRMRARGLTYAVAAMIGAVVGFFGIFAVTELQFELQGHARMGVSMVIGFGGPFVVALGVGVIVARLYLARATPARVVELARRYEIEPHRLREVADLVRGL